MNILASSSASANAWFTWDRQSPIWSMAPARAVFLVVSFTAASTTSFLRHSQNDNSKMEQNTFDLCGIAAMGEIFSSLGGSCYIESHGTSRACFVLIFLAVSAAKCLMASGDKADWCGPHLTASHISSFAHGRPIFVGHPNCDHSKRMSAAGCCSARPARHIKLRCTGLSLWFVGGNGILLPVFVHGKTTGCTAFYAIRWCLLSLCIIPLLWPRMTMFKWSRGWHSPPQVVAGSIAVSFP